MDNVTIQGNYSGFFSNCNMILISIITFFNNNKKLPNELITNDAFTIYKTNQNEDIYNLIFSNNSDIYIKNYENEINFNDEGFENQFSDYKLIKLNDINPFFRKYFNLNSIVLENVNVLLNKYNINIEDEICGVFYRGNDKVKETQKPPYDEFILKAKELKEKNNIIKFIVQTDEIEFLNAFIKEFPDSIFFNEIAVINSNDKINVGRILDDNIKINHVINFVSIIYIFSKLKYLITTSGNCELFIIFFRNNTNNLFQYLKKNKYIHGGLNMAYDENNNQVWY
jgi:hypothetical protein